MHEEISNAIAIVILPTSLLLLIGIMIAIATDTMFVKGLSLSNCFIIASGVYGIISLLSIILYANLSK